LPQTWKIYLDQTKLAVHTDADIVLIGDSLVQFWDTKTWAPIRAVNLGVAGDRTQHVLWRLSTSDWSKISSKKILIILGTNNLSVGDKPCAITFGLSKVVERVAQLWPSAQIGYVDIPPRGMQFQGVNEARTEVNNAMHLLPGIKSINVDNAVTCGWRQPCQNYAPDNLHFTASGYEILLNAVKTSLFLN